MILFPAPVILVCYTNLISEKLPPCRTEVWDTLYTCAYETVKMEKKNKLRICSNYGPPIVYPDQQQRIKRKMKPLY